MNEGLKNEMEFIKLFNNKVFSQLDPISQDFLSSIYKIKFENDKIHAYKGMRFEKADIVINIRNIKKFISIKMGDKNSVHAEDLIKFVGFLKSNDFSKDLIEDFLFYHYGDNTLDNSGNIRFSVRQLKDKYPELFIRLNIAFVKLNIDKITNKFLFQGNLKYNYRSIDGFIYGIPNDFMWGTKEEIYNYIKINLIHPNTGVHYSIFSIQPMSRCLNYNPRYEKYREIVQIKWFNMGDVFVDILHKRTSGFYHNEIK